MRSSTIYEVCWSGDAATARFAPMGWGSAFRPDGTQTINYYTNNLLMSVANLSSVPSVVSVVNYSYDGFLRLKETHEPAANGETRTTTYAYNPAGVATSITVTAGSLSQPTAYVLDSRGRRTQTVLPDGGAVTNTYSTRGEMVSQSGSRTYPVAYSFDDQWGVRVVGRQGRTLTMNIDKMAALGHM